MVSVVIPARNEPYLAKTITDVLAKARGEIEVIAVLDGWWDIPENFIIDDRVSYVHFSVPRGMRAAINAGVRMARGRYILKCDAHCLFDEGFDVVLVDQYEPDWVVVPRRYALDPEKWELEKRLDDKYPIDYMYLSKDLHGEIWKERDMERADKKIDELMSAQGSCWFMSKAYYNFLELLDEATYGTFWNEFQEIGLKAWLSGGKVMVNKNTYYAHWHKTGSRGYQLPPDEKEKAQRMVRRWLGRKMFRHQITDVASLVEHFAPVPTWV